MVNSLASAVEIFVAITSLVVGVSHIVQRTAWADVFARLHRAGRAGAFANGAISLVPGAFIVAGHHAWTWPAGVLTAFGWLMILKGAMCFLAPDRALRSMAHGASTPSSFVPGGVVLLMMGALAGWLALRTV